MCVSVCVSGSVFYVVFYASFLLFLIYANIDRLRVAAKKYATLFCKSNAQWGKQAYSTLQLIVNRESGYRNIVRVLNAHVAA